MWQLERPKIQIYSTKTCSRVRVDDSTYSNTLHHKPRVHTSRSKDSNFFLAHFQIWSNLYSHPSGCLRNPIKVKKTSDENIFSVWVGVKAVYWKGKVCLLSAFWRCKSLTASSYTIKILQVFLQISDMPYLRSTYWHFTIFTLSSMRQFLSGTSMIWKTWDMSQAHTFTPEHEWEILKPFSREKSPCQ